MFELIIIYLLTIVASFFIFRDCIKDNLWAFDEIKFNDLIFIAVLLVLPVFNVLISWKLHYILKTESTDATFTDILKQIFFI